YLSCLLSLLVTGAVRAPAQAARPLAVSQPEQPEPRSSRIPATDASAALESYLVQAGTALVYVIEHVRGVQTNKVEGRYDPREALERLVADTVLTVVEDAQSGALMIKRKPSAPE